MTFSYAAYKVEYPEINRKIFNESSVIFRFQFRFVFKMIIRACALIGLMAHWLKISRVLVEKFFLDASNPKEMEEAGKHGLAILGGETPLWKLICLRLIFKVIIYDLK